MLRQRNIFDEFWEFWRTVIAILSTIALLITCTVVPVLISRHFHPAAGCVVAVACLFIWAKLVRPMPGLIQGAVAISGIAAIFGIIIVCVVSLFRAWPA